MQAATTATGGAAVGPASSCCSAGGSAHTEDEQTADPISELRHSLLPASAVDSGLVLEHVSTVVREVPFSLRQDMRW